MHKGADYGTGGQKWPLYALESGTILSVNKDAAAGNYVWARYPRLGIDLVCMHMDSVNVGAGQAVTKDTVIGNTGTTGNSTGVHLHLGMRKSGTDTYLDPHAYEYTDATTAAPPTVAPPANGSYIVGVSLPGHMSAADAIAGRNRKVTVAPGTYYVYNRASGAVNVTKRAGAPGAWINPEKNTVTASTAVVMKYTVKSGDTMTGIARRFGISLDKLKAANPQVKAPQYMIRIGDILSIPAK